MKICLLIIVCLFILFVLLLFVLVLVIKLVGFNVQIVIIFVVQIVVQGSWCDLVNVKCDLWCYLVQMLLFFGVVLGKIVIEIILGGGWYLEILVLLLCDNGIYVVVVVDLMVVVEGCGCDYQQCSCDGLEKKFVVNVVLYGKICVVVYDLIVLQFGVFDLADVVFIFCNVYNWCSVNQVEGMFKGFYSVFKFGGVLGVVEYCVMVDVLVDDKSGYVGQKQVIVMVEVVGFMLVGSSEINVNLCDIKDYFNGVWMLFLFNNYEVVDDVKYQVIGESDCMILCFVKFVR